MAFSRFLWLICLLCMQENPNSGADGLLCFGAKIQQEGTSSHKNLYNCVSKLSIPSLFGCSVLVLLSCSEDSILGPTKIIKIRTQQENAHSLG